MRILVTGPTGAIGQYVLEALMQTDHEVRVLSLPDSMHRINYRDRIEIVMGELSDPIAMAEAVDGIDIIYHCALVGPPPAKSAKHMMHVNADGTQNLIDHAIGKVKRFVLCTSSVVYTPHEKPWQWPVTDEAHREPFGGAQQIAHSESLMAAEDAVTRAHLTHGLEYAILRPTLVSGRKSHFIEQMVIAVLRQPDGLDTLRQVWDTMQWVHGSDVASAALLAGEHPKAANQRYLVANDEPITIYDVQALTWDIMNVGKTDNPFRDLAARHNLGLRKYHPAKLHALGWTARMDVKACISEVLGRLEFYSSAGIKLPPHLIGD